MKGAIKRFCDLYLPPAWWWGLTTTSLAWTWGIYLYGWVVRPAGTSFTWLTQDHALDVLFYLSAASQQSQGHWFFQSLFTTEPHRPALFLPFHWIVGWLASSLSISPVASYHIVRSIGIVAFHFVSWRLGSFLLSKDAASVFSFLLASTAGLLVVWHPMPELYSPMALLATAWLVWGLTLTMGVVFCLLCDGGVYLLYVTVLSAALSLVDPSPLPALLLTVLAWSASHLMRGYWLHLYKLLAILPAVGILLWISVQAMSDPVGRAIANPPLIPPPLWRVLLSHGLLILAALTVVTRSWKNGPTWQFVILWTLACFLVVYCNPGMRPRRLFEGLHIPLALLATNGWCEVIRKDFVLINRFPYLFKFILIPLLLSGTIHYSWWQLKQFGDNERLVRDRKALTLYLTRDDLNILRWLKEQEESGAVLASYLMAAHIPYRTRRTVFVGHWSATVDVKSKILISNEIFSGQMPVDEAKALFQKHRIRFALSTPYERFQVRGSVLLGRYGVKVYQSGRSAIYRLNW